MVSETEKILKELALKGQSLDDYLKDTNTRTMVRFYFHTTAEQIEQLKKDRDKEIEYAITKALQIAAEKQEKKCAEHQTELSKVNGKLNDFSVALTKNTSATESLTKSFDEVKKVLFEKAEANAKGIVEVNKRVDEVEKTTDSITTTTKVVIFLTGIFWVVALAAIGAFWFLHDRIPHDNPVVLPDSKANVIPGGDEKNNQKLVLKEPSNPKEITK